MKKFLTVILCAVVLFIGVNTVEISAATNEVQPRALACDCGGSFSGITSNYTPWSFDRYAPCPDNSYYTCKKYTRTKTTTYRCNKCGAAYSTNKTEISWTHTH